MATKTTIDGTIPFLKKYTPYTPEPNYISADNLADMVSYNLQKQTRTIQYAVGAKQDFNFIFTIKNITSNIQLRLTYYAIQPYFFINIGPTQIKPTQNELVQLVLAPGKTQNLYVYLDKQLLNSVDSKKILNTNLTFNINNVFSGTAAIRNKSEMPVSVLALPVTSSII